MDLFCKIGEEWDLLKKEVQELRRENRTFSGQMDFLNKEVQELRNENRSFSHQITTMSRQHDKEVKSLRKECSNIKSQNAETLDDVDKLRCNNAALAAELADLKRLFNRGTRMTAPDNHTCESLKRVFNQVLVSAQDKKEQTDLQNKEVQELRKENKRFSDQMDIRTKEIQELRKENKRSSDQMDIRTKEIQELRKENKRFSDQMDIRTKEIQELRKENKRSSDQMAAISMQHDNEMRALRKEFNNIQTQNDETVDDVYKSRRSNANLKKLILKIMTSSTIASPSGESMTTQSNLSSTSSTTSEASGMQMTTNASPSAQGLSTQNRDRLMKRCGFYVSVNKAPQPIQPKTTVMIKSYDTVYVRSALIDKTTGIFTTPVKGTYEFDVWMGVYGIGVVRLYICGNDGSRKMVGERFEVGKGLQGSVLCDFLEDTAVWVEVEGGNYCDNTTFKVGVRGWLSD